MEELTLFDWAVIGVVGLSALLALFRGFVREVMSLATWITTAIVTINFYEDVQAFLHPAHMESKTMAMGAAVFGTFLVVLVVLSIISTIIVRFINSGGNLSLLDSLMGMLFGVARGVFMISLAYLMFTAVLPEDDLPDWLGKSKTRPLAEMGRDTLAAIAPDYVQKMSDVSKEAQKEGQKQVIQDQMEKIDNQVKSGDMTPAAGSFQRDQLEQLLDKLEKEGLEPEKVKEKETNLPNDTNPKQDYKF